jgi:excisionase family DNA binding protein
MSLQHPTESPAATSTRLDARALGLVRAAYCVNDTVDLLSIGRTTLYKLVKSGDLPAVKLGKRTLFYAADIAALMAKLREKRRQP